MEHTIYLAVKAFIEELNPRPPKRKTSTKNGSASVEDADDDNDDNDDLDDWIEDWEQLDASSEDDNIDDVIDFSPGDVLGKVLAFINQVSPLLHV